MKFFKKFIFNKKKISQQQEQKSYDNYKPYFGFSNSNYSSLSMALAQLFYKTISPLSTGIDLISEEFESVQPLIFDEKEKEFSKNNPLIELLKLPNSDQTKTEFFGSICRYYLINANAFIVATGNINRSPLELISINPADINVQKSTKDSFASHYTYTSDTTNIIFNRIEEKGRFRFVDKSGIWELWHIRDFGMSNLVGLSKLNAIYMEIEQYLSSNKHNLSILKKGARSSGVLSTEASLTPDKRDYIREQFNEDYTGEDNAGRVFLLDGGKFNFEELSKSLKDMDFKKLKTDMEKSIYNRLKVPLPLVSPENQKFENIFQAKLGLWDNAVTPLIEKIFNELALFLFRRFNLDINNKRLWFNLFDVPILRQRHIKNTINLYEKRVITIDEARKMIALSNVTGGDVIYQPVNMVPLGKKIEDEKKYIQIFNYLINKKNTKGKNIF